MDLRKTIETIEKELILSVVIPAFNEELVIEESIKRISHILETSKIKNEIVVVNDGSNDRTLETLLRIKKRQRIRIINLANNSGHMNAIRAGMEASIGSHIVTIDADLQDPPEAIPEMYKLILSRQNIENSGFTELPYDVVQAYRADRKSDTFWKRTTASVYYGVVKKITGINVIPHAADFRIVNRNVVDQLLSLPERKLVFRLLIPSLGFRIVTFPIERYPRYAGKSKYTNLKMIGLAIDSVIGFTNRPLRFLAFAGITASLVLFLGSIVTLLVYILGDTIPGWPSLAMLILSFNAFLFAGLGLVGEYVGRIYQLVQSRPLTPWNEL
jgi:glycosyltransferase involved in cell wall biosynthesis